MNIDEFLDKIEKNENFEQEIVKDEIDLIVEEIHNPTKDKIAVCDKVIESLKEKSKKLNEESQSINAKVTKTKELLLQLRNKISEGNLASAEDIFQQIEAILILIPEDYVDVKKEIEKDFSSLKANLLTKLVDFEKKDLDRKSRIISVSIEQAKRYVKDRNVDGAIREYKRAEEVYHSLPLGYASKKVEIYKSIVEMYKEILIAAQISSLQHRLDN